MEPTMSLYRKVEQYDRCNQCFTGAKTALEEAIDSTKEDIAALPGRARLFSAELREMQAEKKRGGRLQIHRIEDHWDAEKVAEFDHLFDLVGGDVPTGYGYYGPNAITSENPIKAVKGGMLWQYKNDLHVNPNVGRKLRNGSMAIGATALASTAFGYFVEIVEIAKSSAPINADHHVLLMAPLVLTPLVAMVAGMYLSEHVKNPFENVATHLEERAAYLTQRLSEVRK